MLQRGTETEDMMKGLSWEGPMGPCSVTSIVLWKIRVQKHILYDLICGIKGKEMYIKLTRNKLKRKNPIKKIGKRLE